ncbi:MAG: putative bifunctional diguanylate cyclase/phosphodiesterase [Halioglobus sp.]
MINSGVNSFLGVIELREDENSTDIYSSVAFKEAQEVFEQRLKGWIRPKDECGGVKNNRVCVVLKDIRSTSELDLAAAKLARVFREPHHYLGREIPLSVTAGFAAFRSGSKDMSVPMRQASIALRQAKNASSLFEVYSAKTGSSAEEDKKLLKRLEIAQERGEFQLYFQPKMHAGYRTLLGAEALLRWHTKNQKVIFPDKFIDLAERNEVIRPITWWSIKSAIGRLALWPEELSIAVNVTPALLIDDDVVEVVRDALEIYGVKPSRLTLEVTETIMIDNQEQMLRQLTKLRKMGIRIALDDFGTGYSSLAYFRDLPVDEIKIDRVFVMRMLESKKDLAIVKAVIDLAHNFSMKVVAEGVETMPMADKLTEMRCDVLQGYAFDKALPVEEFEKQYGVR